MKLIVGLGNPEDEANYSNTRHNMGFNTVNKIADKYEIDISKEKFNGIYGTGKIFNEKVIILKPQTYMNLSGFCVSEFVNYFKVELKDLIVIYDDVDIDVGKIRIRKSGSPSTHNGMKSLTEQLGSIMFPRVRVGIGKPAHDMMSHVIGAVPQEVLDELDKSTSIAAEAVETIIKDGIDVAMNKYN